MSQRSLSHAPQDRQLRAALLGNAVFSATTGIAMALAPEDIARLAGLDAPALLRLLGLGLLAFAAVVLWIGTRERLRALLAVLISLADLTWVAASVAFILISPSVMPAGSTSAVLLVALAVLGFALAQLHGGSAAPARYGLPTGGMAPQPIGRRRRGAGRDVGRSR